MQAYLIVNILRIAMTSTKKQVASMLKQIVASILKLDYGEHNLHDKSLVCRSASHPVLFCGYTLGSNEN